MPGSTLKPEIADLIETKNFATLKKAVLDMEIHDLTELLGELEDEELAVVFRLIGRDALNCRFDADAGSYWITHRQGDDLDRYFNQF